MPFTQLFTWTKDKWRQKFDHWIKESPITSLVGAGLNGCYFRVTEKEIDRYLNEWTHRLAGCLIWDFKPPMVFGRRCTEKAYQKKFKKL